jgi:hypothetical protein
MGTQRVWTSRGYLVITDDAMLFVQLTGRNYLLTVATLGHLRTAED